MQEALERRLGLRHHIPPAFFLVGLTLLLLALARPETVVSLPRVEGTIILAFDVSGSMAADDLEPTRMEAAKAAALDFVQHQPSSVLIGVVAFSDSGFAVQAPTKDREAILATINRLTPQRGTSLANGILASLNTIAASAEEDSRLYSNLTPTPIPTPTPVPAGVYTPAAIVLLTDGENNEFPDPLEAAQMAADRGVRIYTVGIGSAAGTTLHVDGFIVHTQLNEAMLQQISQLTAGTYYNAENEQDLRTIYDNLDPQLVIKPEKMEVTSIFAGGSILVLLIGGTFSLLWFSRLP
jgi:Ca-activated chloride channel family protein